MTTIAFKQCTHTCENGMAQDHSPSLNWLKQQTIQKGMFLVQAIKRTLQGLQLEKSALVGHCSATAACLHGSERTILKSCERDREIRS